jgi:predicted ATPase/class 3 adenylate cyclase
MHDPPAGQVAFLFTDLEGSTRYWERRGDVMPEVYARHDAILRSAIASNGGIVYKVIGDAFQAAFTTAEGALTAAVSAQQALLIEPWPVSPTPRIRMALHVCEVDPQSDGDYRTPGLNRLGRLLVAADGGEILLSEAIARQLNEHLPPDVVLRDLGEQRFRDLSPQRVFQVHAAGLPTEAARLRGLAQHRDNLPHQATTFVGRADELRLVQNLLGDSAVRVLTLIGPGGIGKTRLSLAVAAAMVDRYPGGVWFVPLATLSDPDLVLPAVARVFGVRESVDQSTLEALIAHLEERDALLVLDNLEQVLGAASPIAALVGACPRLTVLMTSRAPLAIAGERTFPVPPLAVPNGIGSGRAADISSLSGNDAIRLFADRATLVRPNFAVSAENVEAVAAICQRLDGLPLAIELAAARTRLLTPPQLLARLESRLPFLTSGPRDLPERQQTLRAAIDWSYDLLAPAEQRLLARVGVFQGGATLEAVEAVCPDPDGTPIAAAELFDLVESLARQSLLVVDESTTEPRVRMLETIREYALDRLSQSGEADRAAVRHAAYFLDLAERASTVLAGADQADWLDLLALEHDNLRAALDHFDQKGASLEGAQLAGALWQFWSVRGHLGEGREHLQRALDTGDRDAVPPSVRARALDGAGALAEAQGDVERAAQFHEEALALWRQAGDRIGQARSLENIGLIELHDRGNAPGARACYESALVLYREERDQQGIVSVLRNLGDAALAQEQFSEAAALYEDALVHARQLGYTRDIAASLTSLGALAFFQGDHLKAIRHYEESLPLWRQLDHLPGIALTLGNLGEALDHAGDVLRAKAHYIECLALSSDLGDRQGIAFAKSHLARIARQDGDPTHAATLFAQSARICHEIGDDGRLAEALEGLAGTLADLGDAEEAARLIGAASALRQRTDSPLLAVHRRAYERDLNTIRAALGPERFAAVETEGAKIPTDALSTLLSRWRLRTAGTETATPVGAIPR